VEGWAFATSQLEGKLGRVRREISGIDRSAAKERSRLLSSLIDYELGERWSLRMIEAALNARVRPLPGSLEQARARVAAARSRLEESVATVGLKDFLQTARIRVGALDADHGIRETQTAELPLDLELPPYGDSWWFIGTSRGACPELLVGETARAEFPWTGAWGSWVMASLVAAIGLLLGAAWTESARRLMLLAAAVLIVLGLMGVAWYYLLWGCTLGIASALIELWLPSRRAV
jgi:hypothetical protein